jgi:hypothetical protein
VLRLLEEAPAAAVCRMLALLPRCADPSHLPRVERLLQHRDLDVRVGALRTLALLGSPRAPGLVLRAIQHPSPEVSLAAMGVAHHVPRPEIIRALLAIVAESGWRPRSFDLPRKIGAVRALIAAGQPEGLDALCRLAARRPLLHARAFRRLQAALFQALADSDRVDLEDFLRLGRRLGSSEIAESCRRIERRQRGRTSESAEGER